MSKEIEPDRRGPEEIRQDIDRTRAEMDHTVDALEGRFTPGRIVDELWGRLQHSEGGRVGDVIREHPVPLALMGLGLGWLAVEQRREAKPGAGDGPGIGSRARQAGGWAREKAHRAGEAMSGDGSGGEDEEGLGARAAGSASEAADWTRGQARHQSARIRGGASRLLHDNPVAVGAVTFGLGLAGGLSMPSTGTENRWTGRMADDVKREAREVGHEAAETGKRIAEEATSPGDGAPEPQERRWDEQGPAGPAPRGDEPTH